jgi:hypothetical protein
VDDDKNAIKFAQVFHLMPDSTGSNYWVLFLIFTQILTLLALVDRYWQVHNDVFRLNYG